MTEVDTQDLSPDDSVALSPDYEADDAGLFSFNWEQLQFADQNPEISSPVDWFILSWGRSESADRFQQELQAIFPGARVVREIIETVRGAGTPAFNEFCENDRNRRVVFFADETPAFGKFGDAPGWNWDWAHSLVCTSQQVASQRQARLWIVTATGLIGPERAEVSRPEQYFAWGLGRCHAAESPETWGGLVEIDGTDPLTSAKALARFLSSDSNEDEVVLGTYGLYVPRLVLVNGESPFAGSLDSDGLFIVTGGLKGLSFEVARWLSGRGARRLLVLGRSSLDEGRQDNLRLLESMFSSVEYLALDVGSPEAVSALSRRLEQASERVGGVFHLASSWQKDGKSVVAPLAYVTEAQTNEVLWAKAQGALLIGQLAQQLRADLLVLFSTATATLGSPGQANYAAANSVLDGVARRLNGSSTRALSIAWGPIADAGFGGSQQGSDLHELWERVGIKRLSLKQMFATLDRSLWGEEPNLVAVSSSGAEGFSLPWLQSRPIFSAISGPARAGLALEGLANLRGTDRVDYVLQVLQTNLASILNLNRDEVMGDVSLVDLGVDSLVALEILFTIDREFAISLGFDDTILGVDVTLNRIAMEVVRRLPDVDAAVAA